MVEELLPIAWSGDSAAQCCVGLAYRFGLGVGRDPEEAVRWFRLAADRGDGDACNHLGQMYCRGEGVGGPDHEAALWWFGAAAGRGDRRGLFNLARMYHNGSGGLLPDRVKAMEFVRQAAGLGHPEAWNSLGGSPPPLRNDLGLRFVGGRGDFEDPVEAIQWCHDRVMRGEDGPGM